MFLYNSVSVTETREPEDKQLYHSAHNIKDMWHQSPRHLRQLSIR